MIGRLRRGWAWFVEGLAEALLLGIDRAKRQRPLRIEIGDTDATVVGPDGARLGRLRAGGETSHFEPPGLARSLAGASVDVVIPSSWLFRRDLDPVAVQSRPFLDAFVRHQIERITPWRVADAHYHIIERPMPGDAARIAVAVAVVPKRVLTRWLTPLEALKPKVIRLRAAGAVDGVDVVMPLGGNRSQRIDRLRRAVSIGLSVGAVATAGCVGWLQWEAALVQSDIDDQDQVLSERKSVLARALKRDRPDGDAETKLRQLRDGRPSAAEIVDALSEAVPDTAHLTTLAIDKDHVAISGISTDPSRLVPALETSGRFADVSASAATTRVETGTGDRFSLEMRAVQPKAPAAAGAAGPPTTAAVR